MALHKANDDWHTGSKVKKHHDTGHNYVDRVRVKNSSSNSSGAHRGSGWRQRSLSNLDLSKSSGNCQFRYPRNSCVSDSNNNCDLNDFYSRIEPEKDYEESQEGLEEELYQRFEPGNDFCSLRRTRSLAVIREETYSDLQISGHHTRRSQLIPRAKLVNRGFFREKFNQRHHRREEDSTGSGVETQTSETRESDEYYSNLKRLDSVKIYPPSWQNDKSDLESLNSEYFRNSSHQTSKRDKYRHSQQKQGKGDKSSSGRSKGQFQVLEIEVHQDNSQSSAFPETTTSNSDHSDSCSNPEPEETKQSYRDDTQGCRTSITSSTTLDEINLIVTTVTEQSPIDCSQDLKTGTYRVKKDTQQDTPAFIAYDSVYLSSEESSEETIIQDALRNSLTESQIDKGNEELECPLPVEDTKNDVEKLYTKVNKPQSSKPRILAAEKKVHRTSLIQGYLSNPNRRTSLERLNYISASQILKASNIEYTGLHRTNIIDNQYYSLPDINISRSLRVSESIDDQLRSCYDHNHEVSNEDLRNQSVQGTNDDYENLKSIDSIYDSITRFGRAHQKARQREYSELSSIATDNVSISKSPSVENDRDSITTDAGSEKPREAPTIEVTPVVCTEEIDTNSEGSEDLELSIEFEEGEEYNSYTSNQFRIIVTDSQDNVVEENDISSPTCSELDQENLFKAQPAQVCPNEDFVVDAIEAEETFETTPEMSRPQILHVIDSKRLKDAKGVNKEKTEKEFLKKVDSARCYWSKFIQQDQSAHQEPEERNFVTSIEEEHDEVDCVPQFTSSSQSNHLRPHNDASNYFQSFSPTVEVVELNGEKKATIVKAHNLESSEFDHVRYKVMKSDLFQKNIVTRTKREAQFDGLMQYLQDYSFQELLTNNNVVIIEPVRTKIEKPCETKAKLDPINCKITGGSGSDSKTNCNGSSGASKRHFFYHPVRVNRELLEEELPNPDTVRNVRKFFEDNVLCRQANQGNTRKSIKTHEDASSSNSSGSSATNRTTTDEVKRRSLRYLTVDTSFGNSYRKWDSASLSSGISSGDLSSPCGECNDHDDETNDGRHQRNEQKQDLHRNDDNDKDQNQESYSSTENLCDDDICESYYVSEDVLAKIRECGSSVTYYGGRVVDNRSPQLSPMTKAIMNEIRGKDVKCNSCQPNNCPSDNDIQKKFSETSNFGMKFKLVKSNSCSSRLELVGTGKTQNDFKLRQDDGNNNTVSQMDMKQIRTPSPHKVEHEESVRELVNRLETGTINSSSVPRIIESQCIEKTSTSGSDTQSITDEPVTINNHLITSTGDRMSPVDILKQVSVNNHISYFSPLKPLSNESKDKRLSLPATSNRTTKTGNVQSANKVCRNKNVDLAFKMSQSGSIKPNKTEVTEVRRSSISSTTSTTSGDIIHALSDCPSSKIKQTIKDFENTSTTSLCATEQSNGITDKHVSHTQELSCRNTTKPSKNSHNGINDSSSSTTTALSSSITSSISPSISPSISSSLCPASHKQDAVDKSFEKHFVANDRKLIERRKYDEIEFESFEIYDPDQAEAKLAAAATNNKMKSSSPTGGPGGASDCTSLTTSNECFDSLDERL